MLNFDCAAVLPYFRLAQKQCHFYTSWVKEVMPNFLSVYFQIHFFHETEILKSIRSWIIPNQWCFLKLQLCNLIVLGQLNIWYSVSFILQIPSRRLIQIIVSQCNVLLSWYWCRIHIRKINFFGKIVLCAKIHIQSKSNYNWKLHFICIIIETSYLIVWIGHKDWRKNAQTTLG